MSSCNEADKYYKAEDDRRVAEAIAAAAAGIFALVLADRFYDIADDALDKEYNVRDRIFEIQDKYINHWETVDYPQKTLVADTIHSLSAPVANYSGILSDVSIQGYGTGDGANIGIDEVNKKNRVECGKRGCVTDVDVRTPLAIVQSTNYLFRHQERRFYDVDEDYRVLAASTHKGLENKPDQAFALMGNAASLYSAIGGAAMQATSNAASTAGGFFGMSGRAWGSS